MKKKTAERLLMLPVLLLSACLVVLTALLFSAFRENSSDTKDFDLRAVTADRGSAAEAISDCLMPGFAGITSGGTRGCITGSANAMRELCGTLYPVLGEALVSGTFRAGSEEEWKAIAESDSSVYLRWQSELPDAVVALFAAGEDSGAVQPEAYQSEVFLIPYVRGENAAVAAFRSSDGAVRIAKVTMPKNLLSGEDLTRFIRTFRNSVVPFVFRDMGGHPQPVVTGRVSLSCIFMTPDTAAFILDSANEKNAVLSLFGLNPDKLLSERIESDGGTSLIETRGEVYVGDAVIAYRSTSENGVGLQSLIGYSDNAGLAEYIQASLVLFDGVRSVNRWLTGGEADLLLTSVYAEGGRIRITFSYGFDNIPIDARIPAYSVTFEGARITEAEICTLAVQGLGSRGETKTGSWFYRWLEKKEIVPEKIFLVYPTDFVSESVLPEWAAE